MRDVWLWNILTPEKYHKIHVILGRNVFDATNINSHLVFCHSSFAFKSAGLWTMVNNSWQFNQNKALYYNNENLAVENWITITIPDIPFFVNSNIMNISLLRSSYYWVQWTFNSKSNWKIIFIQPNWDVKYEVEKRIILL